MFPAKAPLGIAASAMAGQTSLQAAASAAANYSGQLAVEQDDLILMEGQYVVWNGEDDKGKDDSSTVFSLNSTPPRLDDDDGDSL